MKTCLSIIVVCGMLLASSAVWSKGSSGDAQVVIAYISTLRCTAQHPVLKRQLKMAFGAWKKRNRKYVASARKKVDFASIANRYKSMGKHDRRFPLSTCKAFIRNLNNPKYDVH